jgi:hypothetical protein
MAAKVTGSLAAVGGSLARFLSRDSAPSRAAARRAVTPHPAAPRARRNAPCMAALGELAGPIVARQARRPPGERSQGPGLPRIVRVGSSSLNGASHPRCARTRLRRAVDPGDLGRPSEPDGKGQARGQARNARRTS